MLSITTPNVQQENGNSKLNSYTFSGNSGRKFFIVENSGPITSIDFTLSLSGGTGGFRIFPANSGSTAQDYQQNILNTGDKVAFSVDYNSEWGLATFASLTASSDIYAIGSTTNVLLGPTTPINFTWVDNAVKTGRDIGILFSQDEDGNYQVQQASSKITEDKTSFGLVRTNPKLTGNVKITVDSDENIWLNSIDAVKELADDKYKRYRIVKESSYVVDVNRFFDYGGTPPELVFSLYQADSQYTSTKRSFSQQYDRFYQYGVSQLKSKFYDEDFSFFAPLYLKKEIPDYFVIFRTDGAINKFSYDLPFDQWSSKVTEEVLSKSHIIKVFDMRENSSIGTYLRNIVNHPSRPESDLTVSYQQNGYTTFNGILYTKGSFAQMGELLYDYYNQENPLISVEEFITLGFERNKVLSSHVINLEFLFDDPEADQYSINRYFGFYVNAIDLAKFTISEGGLQAFSLQLGQLPLPRKGVDGSKISQKSFIQKNSNGISIFVEVESIKRSQDVNPKKVLSSIISRMSYDISNIYLELPGNLSFKLSVGENLNLKTHSGLTASASLSSFYYAENVSYVTLDLTTYVSSTPIEIFSIQGGLSCNFYEESKYNLLVEKIFDNQFVQGIPRFFYIKDDTNKLHSVKETSIRYYNSDPFTQKKVIELKLGEKSFDISKLGGFSNILTQAECISLPEKGRSSLFLEVVNFFQPNDYLEISWEPGPTTNGYPLRWRVVANNTVTNPGEIWPDYTVSSDSNGEYYLTYFNTGNSSIFLSDFVKSIGEAFNIFPFRNFEVLAKGNFLYFRSTQEGRISNSAKLSFFNFYPAIKIMGIAASSTGSVNFLGGSDRKFTRGKLAVQIAEGMLLDEYVSTKGSFSLLKSHDVLGKKLIFAPYLEEPIYDESGEKLIDFNGCETYRIVCLEDERQPIQLTSDGRLTTYKLFEPTYGVLSVMPLRDFDTDFFFSEYTKNYLPELIEYFSRYAPPGKIVSITPGPSDIYTFDTSYEFDSYPADVPFLKLFENGTDSPVLFNKDVQFRFNGPGYTAEILTTPGATVPAVGDTILLMPGEKQMYFSDSELARFKGFLGLSGIVSSEDEATFKSLENLWDPTRFTFQLLDSEYDRLSENYLKSLVLKSRVVPYISKWVSTQGKDIRDNPYRFNYHRSFGNMNFSPSLKTFISDPRFHTHEWPYLHAVPDKYPIAQYPEYAFSYMFEPLSTKYDFSSLKRDWFSQYFSVGYPTELYKDISGDYISAKIDPSEKYAFFKYQEYDDKTTALFRGFKFSIKEIDSNGAPVKFSRKYNNYRFSAVMETVEDNSFNYENPVEFKTVVNEKWKFILLKITVRTSSYRFTTGKLRYTDLYTLFNNNEVAKYLYDLSYTTSLTSYQEAIPTDKKLTTPINFSTYSSDPSLVTAFEYYDTYLLSNDNYYIENMQGEIVPLASGMYSRIIAAYDTGSFFRYTALTLPPDSIYSRSIVKVPWVVGSAFLKISTLPIPISIVLPYIGVNWKKYTFYHEGGGNSAYEDLRERLTFAEILKVIQGTSDKSIMQYEIYAEDGSFRSQPNFVIEPISPESLTRIYDYYPVSDSDKPQEFYTFPNIGNVLEQQKDLQTIYRYQGSFSPKFRDVLKFWLREDEFFTDTVGKDFLLSNTHIGSELTDFSLLRNQYYFKVSDSEVLRLSPDSGYQPVYPLIDEIAIDKRDLFAWSSSWDKDYYRKYSSVSDFLEVKGTEEMMEVKSMLGSKVMKVPQQYDLYEFKLYQAPGSNLSSYLEEELSYYENTTNAYIQVNVYNRLLREMMGTSTDYRAKTEFLKTMNYVPESFDPALIDDYVKLYLKKNILDLFEISEVKLYVIQTGNPDTNSIATVPGSQHRPLIEYVNSGGEKYSLSEISLTSKNYVVKKDTKLTSLGNLVFSIDYPLDSRYYTSLSIGVTVKRI